MQERFDKSFRDFVGFCKRIGKHPTIETFSLKLSLLTSCMRVLNFSDFEHAEYVTY